MSVYEQVIQEGVEQGTVKAIRAMLKLAMPIDAIAAAMELTVEQVEAYVAHSQLGEA